MILRRHSVFFKLHAFFFLALIVLGLLFVSALHEQERQKFRLLAHRAMELSQIVEQYQAQTCNKRNSALIDAGFETIKSLPNRCEAINLPNRLRSKLNQHNVKVIIYKDDSGFIYELGTSTCTMFYRDTVEGKSYYFVWLLFFALMGGLISLYLLLWKNLKPLKHLYEQINDYALGKETINTINKNKDEIALISNAFNDAVDRQNKMKRSRELFLRNMMHELKTPIMKGKLIVALDNENPHRLLLEKLFQRLEHLITQMADLEKMQAFALHKEWIRLDDMITIAIDHLLIDPEALVIKGAESLVYVDSELFISALQNLIDNAYRHAEDGKISLIAEKNKVCIINKSEPLKRPIEEALEAFVTERSEGGLGLGLYIAQSVCELHRFKLEYSYKEGHHHFCILMPE